MKNIIKSSKLNNLADKLIEIILKRNDPFDTLKIVINNLKVEQWFKAYWLSKHSDVLMNVEFININDALLSLMDIDKQYKILNKDTIRCLVVKHLSNEETKSLLPTEILEYLYENENINPIKLYDLADCLSSLFVEYNNDCFKVNGWQKAIYDLVINDATFYNQASLNYIYENKKGFKEINNIYFFGFISFNKIQETIIDELTINNDITFFMLENDDKLSESSVISSPSLLREIETVHSKICDLVNKTNCKYSDFLVLAPDISVYEGIIPRVFNQDNILFPSIPFSINDKKSVVTNVTAGLNKLFEIVNKGFYTRHDFFELINNQDVKNARNLSEEDVSVFTDTILAMNVYRNKESNDDWKYAKHRILLSKVSGINDLDNNIVELDDESYLPYSTIDLDDETIIKFVSIIDDLTSWCELIKQIKYIDKENLLKIKEELAKWFSIKDKNGFETNNYYQKVVGVINNWYKLNISDGNIPLNTLFYFMFDASNVMALKSGDYFTKGVTFADFNSESILSCKYVFFLNAGTKQFPVPVIKKELDNRDYEIYDKEKIQNAFFLQVSNAINHFYVSYINKNLKTDEELYPSTFVIDLKSKITVIEETISLDETRSWDQLFTKKEYKNKDYYIGLLSNKVDDVPYNKVEDSQKHLKKVRLSDMSSFLQEPLQYKSKYLFGRKDDTDSKIKDEYEPFNLDGINRSILIKKLATHLLINKDEEFSDDAASEIYERFNLEHKLPDINETINYETFDSLLLDSLMVKQLVTSISSDYEIITLKDLVFDNGEYEWVLSCNQEFCRIINEKNERIYIQIKKSSDVSKVSKENYYVFLDSYIASLMDVASLNDEVTHDVILIRGVAAKVKYSITSNQAKEVLKDIYEAMNDFDNNVYISIELLKDTKINTLEELVDYIKSDNGTWKYFDDKNMFDYDSQLGYDEETFKEKFEEAKAKQIGLIKFIKEKSEESEG